MLTKNDSFKNNMVTPPRVNPYSQKGSISDNYDTGMQSTLSASPQGMGIDLLIGGEIIGQNLPKKQNKKYCQLCYSEFGIFAEKNHC